jgi:hypothetical protein
VQFNHGHSNVKVQDGCKNLLKGEVAMTNLYWFVRTCWSTAVQLAALSGFVLLVGLINVGEVFPQTATPRQLGEVKVLSGPVPCEGGDCYDIRVTCPEVVAPARARLKVVAPGSTSSRGTILFTTGNFGFALYESAGESRRTLADLAAAGFRTVQLQWIDGWLVASPGKEEGHARLACRPATVARWVHEHLHQPTPSTAFCATGNSGGASQVSYMLSHYGLKEILAAVVPTGGPPMGRLDRGCSPDDPAYITSEPMRKLIDTGFGFVPPGDLRVINPNDVPAIGPCSRGDLSFREKLRQASVASGEGDYIYPRTMVWFVFEGIAGAEVALGTAYYDLLVKAGSPLIGKTVVPDVDHGGLIRSRSGAEKIRDILLNECRLHAR